MNSWRHMSVLLVSCLLVTGAESTVWASDCRPIVEIGPRLDAGKAPLNTRVWIRLAPENSQQFRRKGGKLSVAKLMRAVRLTDISANKDMKFMLRIDADAGADSVISLRPMATFRPEQRYRIQVTLSEKRRIVNEFETGAKPEKAKNPARGEVTVDHRATTDETQALRARYVLDKPSHVAPLYQVFIGVVGKARPKSPTTLEFTRPVDGGWHVDVIARDACKGRLIPPGKRDILTWLRPITWYGSAMGPLVGPFRIARESSRLK